MAEETKTTPLESEILAGEMPVYYTKSNFYRVIHADGMYGGGAPTPGNMIMTVFSHRTPFPEKTVNDAFGREIQSKRVVKYGLENEIEVSVVMSLNTAKVMLQWLQSSIKNTEVELQALRESLGKK